MRERTDVYGCTGIGGEGYSVHSWAAVYCIATVCDARLKRCKRLMHLYNAYNRRYPLIHEIHYLGAY